MFFLLGSKLVKFSKNSYQELISQMKQSGYFFDLFSELSGYHRKHSSIFLRHDVDTSMEFAYDMSVLEADKGVYSTYFVMLRSPMYNLFSRRNAFFLECIVAQGHEIGLHYDAGFDWKLKNHHESIHFEAGVLAELTGQPVRSFSFHQPSSEVISQKIAIPGLVNVYSDARLSSHEYISDSNRDWRGKDVLSNINERKNIQLLTHPMWWMSGKNSPPKCWDEVIKGNFYGEERQVLATERAYGEGRKIKLVCPEE